MARRDDRRRSSCPARTPDRAIGPASRPPSLALVDRPDRPPPRRPRRRRPRPTGDRRAWAGREHGTATTRTRLIVRSRPGRPRTGRAAAVDRRTARPGADQPAARARGRARPAGRRRSARRSPTHRARSARRSRQRRPPPLPRHRPARTSRLGRAVGPRQHGSAALSGRPDTEGSRRRHRRPARRSASRAGDPTWSSRSSTTASTSAIPDLAGAGLDEPGRTGGARRPTASTTTTTATSTTSTAGTSATTTTPSTTRRRLPRHACRRHDRGIARWRRRRRRRAGREDHGAQVHRRRRRLRHRLAGRRRDRVRRSFGVRSSTPRGAARRPSSVLDLPSAIADSGVLFVAAAGQQRHRQRPPSGARSYPASFDLPNILSVAAVDNTGRARRFSNYGKTTRRHRRAGHEHPQHAPGRRRRTRIPGWGWLDGTSMAAPARDRRRRARGRAARRWPTPDRARRPGCSATGKPRR